MSQGRPVGHLSLKAFDSGRFDIRWLDTLCGPAPHQACGGVVKYYYTKSSPDEARVQPCDIFVATPFHALDIK